MNHGVRDRHMAMLPEYHRIRPYYSFLNGCRSHHRLHGGPWLIGIRKRPVSPAIRTEGRHGIGIESRTHRHSQHRSGLWIKHNHSS